MRQRDRGFERIADRIGQQAASGKPAAGLQFARAQRMHEDQDTQFLALGPEGMEPGIGQFIAGHAAPDADAAEAELPDGVFDLFRGEVGVLQRGRSESDEAVGIGGAELGKRFVLDLDQRGGDLALGAIPIRIDAERLDVDALRVHRRDARVDVAHQETRRLERMLDQRHCRRHRTMSVHVDGLDPIAIDDDFTPPRPGVCMAMRIAGHGRHSHGATGESNGGLACRGCFSHCKHSPLPPELLRTARLQCLHRKVAVRMIPFGASRLLQAAWPSGPSSSSYSGRGRRASPSRS